MGSKIWFTAVLLLAVSVGFEAFQAAVNDDPIDFDPDDLLDELAERDDPIDFDPDDLLDELAEREDPNDFKSDDESGTLKKSLYSDEKKYGRYRGYGRYGRYRRGYGYRRYRKRYGGYRRYGGYKKKYRRYRRRYGGYGGYRGYRWGYGKRFRKYGGYGRKYDGYRGHEGETKLDKQVNDDKLETPEYEAKTIHEIDNSKDAFDGMDLEDPRRRPGHSLPGLPRPAGFA